MPRTAIRAKSTDVITDDGSVLVSAAKGEQIHLTFTLAWLTDLTEVPFQEDADPPTVTTLPIIDADVSDNTFKVVITDDLCDTWAVQPTPDDPVYGFFALSVADTGVGNAQQIFVPVRGLIEVRYNPVEST